MSGYGTSRNWEEEKAASPMETAVTRTPEVVRELELLDKRQNALQNTIDELAKRLAPVMRPEALTDKSLNEVEKAPQTQLAQAIQNARGRLELQTGQLRALINLLEI